MKPSVHGCLVQDHTGQWEKTEHHSSSILSLLVRTAFFCPMLWVCLRGTGVLGGRKGEQEKPCGYSCTLQRQDSQAPIVCDVPCSNTEVGEEEREDVQK